MKVRLVSDSARFGVVSPASGSMPWQPRNSVSKCSDRTVRSATGPTRASDGVRIPPVKTTDVCEPLVGRALLNRFITRSELVTIVSPGTSSRHWASANVVVPAEQRDRGPGLDQAGRRPPDRCLLRLFEYELGLEAGLVTAGGSSRQNRAAVNFLDQAIPGQSLQVAPDGHVRDPELLCQIADSCAAVAADSLEDQRLPMPGKHP